MESSTDPLAATFKVLSSHWDDEPRHRAFVSLAAELKRLDDAARFYRDALEDPARRERAEQARKMIVAAALAMVDSAPRSSPEQIRARARWILPAFAAVLFVLLGWLFGQVTGNRALRSVPAIVVEILVALLIPWHRIRASEGR